MVDPIKSQSIHFFKPAAKKKRVKDIDVRVKKALKKSKLSFAEKVNIPIKASAKISMEKALLQAQKAVDAAHRRAFETRKAAVEAQKKAFLAQRAHMAQQAAAARRSRAAEKAKKAAQRAAKKVAGLHRVAKIRAYLAKPEEKKRGKLLKKYLQFPGKKKKKA
jgi:hypothetical protein